ncbi:hypothetical protein HYW35_02590 [Candidatus Saccharibacteria bacterium]|nr:hypothetical protein [Candidatus Saccharibacteria bacterium]
MNIVRHAEEIARAAHAKQKYYIGRNAYPFFDSHVEPVAAIVRAMGYGEKTVAGALLHDVVEDSPWTIDGLREEGIPEETVEAVDAVTERKGETPIQFLDRSIKVARAIVIRFADSSTQFSGTIQQTGFMELNRYRKRIQKHGRVVAITHPILPDPRTLKD